MFKYSWPCFIKSFFSFFPASENTASCTEFLQASYNSSNTIIKHKLNMCLTWMVLQVISTRKMFTLVCCVLTFFLISKILFTFAITKPTSTFKGEKELEFFDLPEIVVCPDPGVKFDVLEKYGYTTRLRYSGTQVLRYSSGTPRVSGTTLETLKVLGKFLAGMETKGIKNHLMKSWRSFSFCPMK